MVYFKKTSKLRESDIVPRTIDKNGLDQEIAKKSPKQYISYADKVTGWTLFISVFYK